MGFSDIGLTAAVGLMVRFTGVGRVFADFAQPAAVGWGSGSGSVTIDGETYSWSRTVHMPKAVHSSARYDPDRHRVVAGGASMDFILPGTQDPFTTNPWLSLLITDPLRADQEYAVIKGTLTATATTATVDSTATWAASGSFNSGIEEIAYTGKTGTTLTGLTRGRHGSKQEEHRAGFSGAADIASGGYITTHPTVWRDRVAKFWLVRGQMVGGVFTPDAADIEDGTVDLLRQYEVIDIDPDGAVTTSRITCNSQEGFIDKQIATRLPRATAGLGADEVLFRVDDTINTLTWTWVTSNVAASIGYTNVQVRLQRDDGLGSAEDVPAGWYTNAEMRTYLAYTIFEAAGSVPIWYAPGDSAQIILRADAEGNRLSVYAMIHSVSGTIPSGTFRVALAMNASSSSSVLRAMGFEGIVETTSDDITAGATTFFTLLAEADRNRAQLYLPNTIGETIVRTYDQDSDLAFSVNPGYVADSGATVGGYVRIGDFECVKFDTAAADGQLTITNRAQLGSRLQEIYVEAGDDPVSIVQGLAFPQVSWPRMLLYLMYGGSGVSSHNDAEYDRAWVGSGAYIAADQINKQSFVDAITKLGDTLRDNWAFFEPTKLRMIMESEGLLANAVIRQKSGLLDLKAVTRGMEAEELASPLTLTVGDQHPNTGARTYSSGENMISNALQLDGAWDHGTNEPRHHVQAYEGTSVTSYGIRNKQSVEVRGVAGIEALIARAQDLTDPYFSLRAFQRATFGLPYARAKVWDAAVLDNVVVSDDLLPSLAVNGAASTVSRGFSGVLCQCVTAKISLPGISEKAAERGRLEFMTSRKDDSRYSWWSPAAQANTVGGGGLVFTVDDHTFSGLSQPKDHTHFKTDYRITCYAVGDYANRVVRTITGTVDVAGADSSTIAVNAAVALTAPLVIEYADYDDPNLHEDQRKVVAMSDGDHKIDKASGSDLMFKHG